PNQKRSLSIDRYRATKSHISGRLPNLPTVSPQVRKSGSLSYIWSISACCPDLARRLSGPALECMRECAHLMKAEQPRNLGHVQLAIIKVTNGQIAPQLLKYFSEVQLVVRKLSCKRSLAHSQAAGNVFH